MNISTFGGADPSHKSEVNMKFPRNRMLSIKSLSDLIYRPRLCLLPIFFYHLCLTAMLPLLTVDSCYLIAPLLMSASIFSAKSPLPLTCSIVPCILQARRRCCDEGEKVWTKIF